MNKKDKELLLKDLCNRLPYGVKISLRNVKAYHHENIAKIGDTTIDKLKGFNGEYFTIYHDNPLDWSWYVSNIDVKYIKPYLYPLSSMTEEATREFNATLEWITTADGYSESVMTYYSFDCLNKHHIDYRGLIPMGLAIDATGLNIY